MAAIDEIVFHQLLGWHHLYDGSTEQVALTSDGLLHLGQLVVLVTGLLLFADLIRQGRLAASSYRAGTVVGLGGFQLFDGTVNHKLLGLHEIRYGVDLLPYDLAWNGAALVVLVAGVVLARRSRAGARSAPQPP
jgi:uncharacterized membrane protein